MTLTTPTARIHSIDLIKGLIMVIMALDHTRQYIDNDTFLFSPTDPLKTNMILFFTRWVTHYCAPAFCLLAGISAYLAGRKRTKKEMSVFLLTRGVWLALIDLTLVNFGWTFDIQSLYTAALVFWSLGISMILLAGIIHLPFKWILYLSLVVIFGHNILDQIDIQGNMLWAVLHQRESFQIGSDYVISIGYPIIPWFAVMSLGYYLGSYYEKSVQAINRQKLLTYTGLISIGLFLVVRGINSYENAHPWESYDNISATIFSFLDPGKYPPSLTYLLMTLGPTLLILGTTEQLKGKVVAFFSIFGKVPFFYYILHIYLIHLIAMLMAELSGHGWELLILRGGRVANYPNLMGTGYTLSVTYLIWILVVLLLYPLCKKFSLYKSKHKDKAWVSYL